MSPSFVENDTFKAMIGDDSDDDSTPFGIYEIEETPQELIPLWSTNSPRYSFSKAEWQHSEASNPTFKRHNTSHLRTSSIKKEADLVSDLSSLFQRKTNNLFGRDFYEASSDLRRLLRPRSSVQNVTPSLTSDDTTSPSSSSSFKSPISVPRDLAPPTVPIAPSSPVKVTELVVSETSEDHEGAVVSTVQTTRTEPIELYPNLQTVHADPSPIHVEEETIEDVTAASAPKPPTLSIGQPNGEAYNWDFSSLSSTSNIVVDEPPSSQAHAFTTEGANPMPYDGGGEERDEILDDEDGEDSYMPDDKPQRRQRQRNKKSAGSFKCRFCTVVFTRNFDMLRHIKSVHETPTVDKKLSRTCPCCGEVLSRNDAFKRHITKVPSSCIRFAKLQGKELPPPFPEAFYELCQAGNPPLHGTWIPLEA